MRHSRLNEVPLVITVRITGLLIPIPASMYTETGGRVAVTPTPQIGNSRFFTVLPSVGATNGRHWTSTGDEELISIADVVLGIRSRQHKVIKVQTELTDIRIHFIDGQLTTSGAFVQVRMVGTDKIRSVLPHDSSARGHDWGWLFRG